MQRRGMILMGIGDEAGNSLSAQIVALKELGWTHVEMRGVEMPGHPKVNFHDLPEALFDQAAGELQSAGIGVYCFGSTIMNWAKRISDPFEPTLEEVKRCIPRMQKVGARYVRIMSYKPGDEEERIPEEAFVRVREVVKRFLDAGIQPVHENCMNYGGMSGEHALELLEKVPGLKWVFDTANPVFNTDRSKPRPWAQQDPWMFWEKVRDVTAHIHVKDARWIPAKKDADYHWPGEGDGKVEEILRDAFRRGYDAGISIEPHMVVVFHDKDSRSNDEVMRSNFVEYGRRLEKLIQHAKTR